MRHRVKNIKFHSGIDSNKMIVRKLVRNFFVSSHIETTQTKAKALKQVLDIVIGKLRVETEANKNFVLQYLPDAHMVAILFQQVGPAVKDIVGGYVRLIRLNMRENDGTLMMRIEWAHPVVIEWKTDAAKDQKTEKKSEKKIEKKVTKKVSKK